VLYLSVGTPQPAADSEETPEGRIVRYDEHDRVIGGTLRPRATFSSTRT
jgi:hypothetical protein